MSVISACFFTFFNLLSCGQSFVFGPWHVKYFWNAEVGIGLIGFGIFFTLLGIVLFFDRGLLALGNVSLTVQNFEYPTLWKICHSFLALLFSSDYLLVWSSPYTRLAINSATLYKENELQGFYKKDFILEFVSLHFLLPKCGGQSWISKYLAFHSVESMVYKKMVQNPWFTKIWQSSNPLLCH